MATFGSKNSREDKLILALAAGCSVREAARRSGFGVRTAYRKTTDPAFQERITKTRSLIYERAASRLAGLTIAATATLKKLLDSGIDQVRLAASKAILDCSLRIREAVEIEARLRRLEEQHGHHE